MTPVRAAGFRFIAAALAFPGVGFATAALDPRFAARSYPGGALAERLAAIGEKSGSWTVIMASLLIAAVLTVGAAANLTAALIRAGDSLYAPAALASFAVASAAWLVAISFQLGTTQWAAAQYAETKQAPAAFELLESWWHGLYGVYMTLAFGSLAAFGGSLLRTGVAPTWMAWTMIIFNAAMAVSFVTHQPKLGGLVISDLPLWIQLISLVLDVTLLFRYPG